MRTVSAISAAAMKVHVQRSAPLPALLYWRLPSSSLALAAAGGRRCHCSAAKRAWTSPLSCCARTVPHNCSQRHALAVKQAAAVMHGLMPMLCILRCPCYRRVRLGAIKNQGRKQARHYPNESNTISKRMAHNRSEIRRPPQIGVSEYPCTSHSSYLISYITYAQSHSLTVSQSHKLQSLPLISRILYLIAGVGV